MAVIYILSDAGLPGACKIGKDTRWPFRFKQARCYSPRSLQVDAVFETDDARAVETRITEALRSRRRRQADGGEWYDLGAATAADELTKAGILDANRRRSDVQPTFRGAAREWDDWREWRDSFLLYRWRIFLFEEQSEERRLKASVGALYDAAFNNCFTFNPFKVKLIAGFEHVCGVEEASTKNMTSNKIIQAAWNRTIERFGVPGTEEVGWLRQRTTPMMVASNLEQESLILFRLDRPKPLGAPPRDQGSPPAVAFGKVPWQAKVKHSEELYGRVMKTLVAS